MAIIENSIKVIQEYLYEGGNTRGIDSDRLDMELTLLMAAQDVLSAINNGAVLLSLAAIERLQND